MVVNTPTYAPFSPDNNNPFGYAPSLAAGIVFVILFVYLGVDFISLVMQAAGGGIVGQAFSSDVDTQPGTYTMVAGILFHLASTITFSVLMSIAFWRGFGTIKERKSLRMLAGAMTLAIMCMIARGVYRSVELLQGWQGNLTTHEVYVIGLDGASMVVGVVVLNVFNPRALLAKARAEKEEFVRPPLKEVRSDIIPDEEAKRCVSDLV